MPRDEALDRLAILGIEVASAGELVGEGSHLVAGPGLEGGDELALVDQADLKRQQAEQEVAFGGHGVPPVTWSRSGPPPPGVGRSPIGWPTSVYGNPARPSSPMSFSWRTGSAGG